MRRLGFGTKVAVVGGAFFVVAALIAAVVVWRTAEQAGPGCPDVRFGSTAAHRPSASPLGGIRGTGARLRVALGLAHEEVVYCHDFADPFVLRVGSRYYAYSTNTLDAHVPVMRSAGLFDSGDRHDALPVLPGWAKPGATWAPSVLPIAGRYVLYFTTTVAATGQQCLSHATAPSPDGPFADPSTAPWICPAPGGAIDASPVVAADGTPFLVWKSDDHFSGIVGARLSPDGLSLAGAPSRLLSATEPWEAGTVEGPDLVATPGGYFLFYSGGDWRTAGYGVGAARCASPLGPCTRVSPRPLIASVPNAAGPGGEQVFADQDGRSWMVLHAWVGGRVGYPQGARGLFAVPIDVTTPVPTIG